MFKRVCNFIMKGSKGELQAKSLINNELAVKNNLYIAVKNNLYIVE